MIYTKNDLKIGDLIYNPYDKDQVLEITAMPFDEDYFEAENVDLENEELEKWKIEYCDVKRMCRTVIPKYHQRVKHKQIHKALKFSE